MSSYPLRFGRHDYGIFLLYVTYAAGSLIVPLALVQIALDLGFTLQEGGRADGGGLLVARSVAMMVTLVACGFWAGRWGTRRTLGVSILFMAAGIGLVALAPWYGVLFLAMLLAGLGEGVIEGLATPFIQDMHADEPGRYTNFGHSFWSVGMLATVIICGGALAYGVSWRLLAGGIAVLGLIPAILILQRPGPGETIREHAHELHWTEVWGQARQILRMPRFWLFYAGMFLGGGGEFCLTFWAASHIQMNFGASAWYGGLGTGCFALGMLLARTLYAMLIRDRHLPHLVTISAFAGVLVTMTLPWVAHSMGLFFWLLFLSGVATAPLWPSVQSYSVTRLPKADMTMLLILLSCAGIPGCGALVYLMGVIGDLSGSLASGFYLVPVCYGALGCMVLVDWLALPPQSDKPAAKD